MPNFAQDLRNIVMAGDAIGFRRTVDRTASNMPTGVKIIKAWMTVKAATTDADPGLVQKAITTANQLAGQIENDGTGDTNPVVRFDFGPGDTRAIGSTLRYYDMQVLTEGLNPYTFEAGLISAIASDITITAA